MGLQLAEKPYFTWLCLLRQGGVRGGGGE